MFKRTPSINTIIMPSRVGVPTILSCSNNKLLEELSGTDILILNVPFPGNKGDDKHLNTENAIKIVSHVRPRLVVLTGFGLEMLKADPLSEAREVQRITGVQTIAARDGLSIAPAGYKEYKSPVRGFD